MKMIEQFANLINNELEFDIELDYQDCAFWDNINEITIIEDPTKIIDPKVIATKEIYFIDEDETMILIVITDQYYNIHSYLIENEN